MVCIQGGCIASPPHGLDADPNMHTRIHGCMHRLPLRRLEAELHAAEQLASEQEQGEQERRGEEAGVEALVIQLVSRAMAAALGEGTSPNPHSDPNPNPNPNSTVLSDGAHQVADQQAPFHGVNVAAGVNGVAAGVNSAREEESSQPRCEGGDGISVSSLSIEPPPPGSDSSAAVGVHMLPTAGGVATNLSLSQVKPSPDSSARSPVGGTLPSPLHAIPEGRAAGGGVWEEVGELEGELANVRLQMHIVRDQINQLQGGARSEVRVRVRARARARVQVY